MAARGGKPVQRRDRDEVQASSTKAESALQKVENGPPPSYHRVPLMHTRTLSLAHSSPSPILILIHLKPAHPDVGMHAVKHQHAPSPTSSNIRSTSTPLAAPGHRPHLPRT